MDYLPLLDPAGTRYLAIVAAISADIQAGRLAEGTLLPGTRVLAQRLGLNRNTVVRAYAELDAQGWTSSRVGSGTRVASARATVASSKQDRSLAGFLLPPSRIPALSAMPDVRYRFVGGQPDLRVAPMTELARAYRRALSGRGRKLVDYGDAQGHAPLRRSLAAWLNAQRGMQTHQDEILVTRGSQQALYLAAHVLFRPGDRVAVEALGYRPAWEALRSAGIELVPIQVDDGGLVVDEVLRTPGLRGVYLTPHHQYPTGVMLSAPRRQALLDHCARNRMAILEDDYDHEFHWAGSPVAPLAARDRHGVVVYLGTLSKALAPGLRLGWVVAPATVIEQLTRLRRVIDRQGDQVVEQAVASLIDDGELQRHIRRMVRLYAGRREHLLGELNRRLPELIPRPGPGGLAIWCAAPRVDTVRWRDEALTRDVGLHIAADFCFDTRWATSGIRFGFAALTQEEAEIGLDRLTASIPLAGTSCDTRRVAGPTGFEIHKTYPSTRGAEQASQVLAVADPQRVLRRPTPRSLHLRWLPGASDPMHAEAHEAAGRWLRDLHSRLWLDRDPLPLEDALQARRDAALRTARERGLTVDLPPIELAGARVLCHRDYRPANWLWGDEGLQVIDFEHSGPDHPLWDLIKLAIEVWPRHPELEEAFQRGYGSFDKASLSPLVALFELQTRLRQGTAGTVTGTSITLLS